MPSAERWPQLIDAAIRAMNGESASETISNELVRDSGWGVVPGRWHDPAVVIMVNRAVLAHRLFTGLSRRHLACLVEE
ncbi:hypothetical protein, partial [Streptomyces sp. NPDC060027]|uniref:hypothetical protein n=1 Tax=Streptomyces sp. NPDC060027 TaxID=3347040 RepID=UPI0036861574